jgi:hypothetical protein
VNISIIIQVFFSFLNCKHWVGGAKFCLVLASSVHTITNRYCCEVMIPVKLRLMQEAISHNNAKIDSIKSCPKFYSASRHRCGIPSENNNKIFPLEGMNVKELSVSLGMSSPLVTGDSKLQKRDSYY